MHIFLTHSLQLHIQGFYQLAQTFIHKNLDLELTFKTENRNGRQWETLTYAFQRLCRRASHTHIVATDN
jgi:hypothetical protein